VGDRTIIISFVGQRMVQSREHSDLGDCPLRSNLVQSPGMDLISHASHRSMFGESLGLPSVKGSYTMGKSSEIASSCARREAHEQIE
jgi:hypothetical protein